MKTLLLLTIVLVSLKAFPSVSTIGNGFTTDSILKIASKTKSKTEAGLCKDASKNGDGKIVKDSCVFKVDGKDVSIKMKDLIDAANKNDQGKK